MVMRSAMPLKPDRQLVEQLRVHARIDLALEDLLRATDRERGNLATQFLARLLRVECHLRARALDEPAGLFLRGVLGGLDDLVGPRLRLALDRQRALTRLLDDLRDALLGRREILVAAFCGR